MSKRDVVRYLFALVDEIPDRFTDRGVRGKVAPMRRDRKLVLDSRISEPDEKRAPPMLRHPIVRSIQYLEARRVPDLLKPTDDVVAVSPLILSDDGAHILDYNRLRANALDYTDKCVDKLV